MPAGHTFQSNYFTFVSDTDDYVTTSGHYVKASFSSSQMALAGQGGAAVTISGVADPTSDDHAVNKGYLDGYVEGLDIKPSVRYATQGALPNTPTYDNGTSGVGATLTGDSESTLTVDGQTITTDMRVLVKNQVLDEHNGIYVRTADVGGEWVLTRAGDMDEADEVVGATTYVEAGTDAGNRYHCISGAGFTTMGTDDIDWTQYGGATSVTANSIGMDEMEHNGTDAGTIVYNGSGVPVKLTAGTTGYVLTSQGTDSTPTWTEVSGGGGTPSDGSVTLAKLENFEDGAIIVGTGAGGDPVYLSSGAANTVLVSDGTDVSYSAVTDAMISTATIDYDKLKAQAKGDMLYYTDAGAAALLNAGDDGQVLTLASGAPSWAAASVADSSVTLAKLQNRTLGSLIVGADGSAPVELLVGTSSQVLLGGTTPSWGAVTGSMIDNDTITNSNISGSAAIALNKLADSGTASVFAVFGAGQKLEAWGGGAGTSGQVIVSGGSGLPSWGGIVNNISAGALSVDKLENGNAEGQVLITGGNPYTPSYVTVAGDLSFSAGQFSIAADVIDGDNMASTVYNTAFTGIGLSASTARMDFSGGIQGVAFYDDDDHARLTLASDGSNEGAITFKSDTNANRLIMGATNNIFYNVAGDTATFTLDDSDATFAVDVTGNSWSGSERKWKDELEVVSDALEKLSRIHGYTWVYNAVSQWEGTRAGGIVADELQKVLPDAVKYSEQLGGLKVNYNFLHALAIQAIKELAAKVDAQGVRIAALESNVEALRDEVAGLQEANAAFEARLAALEAQ